MAPGEIRLLIHYHAFPGPYPEPSSVVDEWTRGFVANGLIEIKDNSYTTTQRGAAHIEQLCRTPWPTQAWVDSHGKVISIERD